MTKTKLLLAGVLAGAVAFGTACKTDKGTTNTDTGTGTDTSTMGTDAGTGGAGMDNPDYMDPLPEEGTREMEPDVHEGTHEDPGVGGGGLEPEPLDRNPSDMDRETSDEPLNPGAPANTPPREDGMPESDDTNKSLK